LQVATPTPVVDASSTEAVSPPAKKPRKKRSAPSTAESVTVAVETVVEPVPPQKRRSKKAVTEPDPVQETVNVTNDLAVDLVQTETPLLVSEPAKKKTSRRVGQRSPQRDPVG
jgi:tagatose-1,6-bisphosphate aldolase